MYSSPREQYHDNRYFNEQPSDHRPGLNDRECDYSARHLIHEHPHSRAYPDEYRREHELERTHEYRHHAGNLNLQQKEESLTHEDLTNRLREKENHSRRFGYDRQPFYQSRDKEYSEINQERNYQARPYGYKRDIERYTYREDRECHREWSRSENDDSETLLRALSSKDRGDPYIQQQEEGLTQEDRFNKRFRGTENRSCFRYDSQPLYQTCDKEYSGIKQERNYQARPYEDRKDIEQYAPRKEWERPNEWRRRESGDRESLLRAQSSDDRGRVDRRRYERARHSGWTDRRNHKGNKWYRRDNRKLGQTGRRNVKFNRTQPSESTSCASDTNLPTKPCTISSSKEIQCDMNLADEKKLTVNDINLQKKYDAENTKRTSDGNTANYVAVFSDAETQYIDQDVQSLDMSFHNLLNVGEVKEIKKESDSYSPSASLPVNAITGKKRNRNEKPDKCCDAEKRKHGSSSQKKMKCRINNSDGNDDDIEVCSDVNDSEDNKVSCSSLHLFSDREEINSKHQNHTNAGVYDLDAATKDSKIETRKYEIKLEPDSPFNGYTQEPDIVWVSDDEDNTVIMSFSQPVINLQGIVATKSEQYDSDYDLFGSDNSSNSDFDHETIIGFLLNAKSAIDTEQESAIPLDRNEVMEVGVLEDGDSSAGHSSDNDIIPLYLNDDDSELHVDIDTELDNVMSTHEVKMPGDKLRKNHFVKTETLSPVNDIYMQETQKCGELDQADKFMKKKYELNQLSQNPNEVTVNPDNLNKKDDKLTQAPMTSTVGNCDALIQAGTSAKMLNETEPGVSKKKTATSYSTHLSSVKSVSTSARRHSETGHLMDKVMNRGQQTRRAGDQKQVKTQTSTMNKKSLHGKTPLKPHQYTATSSRVQLQLDSQQRAMGPASPLVQTPTEQLPASLIDNPNVIVWEEFLKAVLKWTPKWLDEAGQEKHKGQPPPVTVDWLGQAKPQIFSLIERYVSYEEYSAKFMLPLLLYETWEQCRKDYLLNKRNIFTYHLIINSIEDDSEPLQTFTMLGFTSRAAQRKGEVVSRNDLVWLSLFVKWPHKASSHTPVVFEAMGMVKNVSYIEESAVIESLSKEHEQLAAARSEDTIVQSISIRLKNRKMRPVKTDLHQLRVVSSLVTSERAVQALRKFPENPLWKHLLFPTCSKTYFHNNRPVAATSKTYNPSQLQAINTARCMLREGGTKPQVLLINGPAGTGKSRTIIKIIKDIIKDIKGHVRICLCTHSNTAIDELVRRLVQSNKSKDVCDQVKVIRLGRLPSIPDDLHDNSLETAVKQVWQAEKIPAGVHGELASLDKKIQIHKDKKKTTKDNNKIAKFTAEIQKLERQKDVIKKQLRVPAGLSTNMKYCLKALKQAHVVAGTLSSMADPNLRQLYRELTAAKKGPLFHCVIIDEAHQGIELETLIPLQYGTAKLIMVGDTEQLASIVLSQKCQECRFDMSLFKRLESYFQTSAIKSPVLLLNRQYRMDPEIALHPNQYSYEGRIQNDRSLYRRPKYPLVPYLVFNIKGTQLFSQASRPMHNPEEASFTADLCEFVIKHGKVRPSAIGIIAPYSNQKMDIERQLRKRRLVKVQVSTVNGFQGQERKVIIISCFRFDGNRNKITVAITRATHAMYIIGDLDGLKSNIEWRALIENAEERNVVVPVTKRTLQSALEKCLINK